MFQVTQNWESDNIADEVGWRLIRADTEAKATVALRKTGESSQTHADNGALGYGGLGHLSASVCLCRMLGRRKSPGKI